ncbi:MAG: S8 family serine peptidase [Candidatus Paceibacterota bacterium]
MKKLLTSLLAILLVVGFAVPTLADDSLAAPEAEVTNLSDAASMTPVLPDEVATTTEEVVATTTVETSGELVATSTDAIETIEQIPVVVDGQNYARLPLTLASSSNDTFVANLWALENRGQTIIVGSASTTGTAGDDIKGPQAWALSEGTSTVVAVIDSGVLYTHPDLAASMWDGTSCKDDQGVALGSCIHGYDFADNDLNPAPIAASTSFAHGTHVAGIIAAVKNNHTGIVGVAPSAKIMALRFGFDVDSEVRAIDFARENGAKIINASYGGTQYSQNEYDAIKRFTDTGGLFVAAAGNSANSSEVSPIYPAAYNLPGIISVAATDQNDLLASFSNFGTTTVDIGAPGVNILSTYTADATTSAYAYADGTSMASPQVAGVVALLESKYPTLSALLVKNSILSGGDTTTPLTGKTVSGKRLNAYGALIAAGTDTTPPVITLTGSSSIALIVGDVYTEQGATALDDTDATTTVTIGGDVVNTSVAGTYHVTYDAVDSHGNAAIQVIRTVTVSVPAPVPAPVVQNSGGGGGGGGGGGSSVTVSSPRQSIVPSTPTTIPNVARPALAFTATSTMPAVLGTSTAPVIPSYHFNRLLKLRMSGVDVTALQQALTRAGVYTGPITGYFGAMTAAGVRGLQAAHNLPQVGSVGPMTRALLNSGI